MTNHTSFNSDAVLNQQQNPLAAVLHGLLMPSSSGQAVTTILILLTTYLVLISKLRFQRMRSLEKKYNYPTRASMAKMTDDEAWEIQKTLIQLEFPFMYIKALQFALFRTYGIPSISTLLVKTSQFSHPETSLKRYSDTSVLIQEFVGNAPTSNRACAALARTRWLHSGYRASGKILDDDMLYTLSLFAICPIRFVEQYEWRSLTDLEKCALGTFWKSVGDGLGISYDQLPSGKHEDGKTFRDGLHWLEEMMSWSEAYEIAKMVPHPKNKETADQTTAVLVYMLPESLKHVGYKFVSFMMDDRLRKAMMYPTPPQLYTQIFTILLQIRKFALRYLSPPRPSFMRMTTFTPADDHSDNNNQDDTQTTLPSRNRNRIYLTQWEAAPYYVKPTLWNRWLSPTAWMTRSLGKPVPGDEGEKYHPGGYFVPDVGPKYFEGKGGEAVEKTVRELKGFRTGGCPFI